MQADRATLIETFVDRAASALFAMAAAYAAYTFLGSRSVEPLLGGETAVAALLAFLLSARVLASVKPEPRKLPIPVFDLRQVETVELDELLLTEKFEPAAPAVDEPLVLDDILAELGPDSRVVRLFDPAAMPTAGQLNQRIERHLERGAPPAPPHDASQALHDALAELRRSLR